jgi:hypothetical protein
MTLNVFYSWQSDLNKSTNENFIESAIQEAIDRINQGLEIEKASRNDELKLDKDTQGVTGSPPIADTILRKIDNTTIFIADVSFVGKVINNENKLMPNPNVLVEYGYALKTLGCLRIILIMNAHYGKPNNDNMPFDIRHLRWPIQYDLSPDVDVKKTNEVKDSLIEHLIKEIKLIIRNNSNENKPEIEHIPMKSTYEISVFHNEDKDFGVVEFPHNVRPKIRLSMPKSP